MLIGELLSLGALLLQQMIGSVTECDSCFDQSPFERVISYIGTVRYESGYLTNLTVLWLTLSKLVAMLHFLDITLSIFMFPFC